jgi:hypothetical protein
MYMESLVVRLSEGLTACSEGRVRELVDCSLPSADRPTRPALGAEAVEEPRASAEDQRYVELELVDEPRGQVLIDDVGAAADDDVLSGRVDLFYRAWPPSRDG